VNNTGRIQLKYENSEYTCFRIMPCFKYQQESQGYIFNDDVVYLMSIVDSGTKTLGDPYLHASRTVGLLSIFYSQGEIFNTFFFR